MALPQEDPQETTTIDLVGYDDLGGYSLSSKVTKIRDVIQRLSCAPDHHVVDLGGGNGYPASIVHTTVPTLHPVTCVDPDPPTRDFPGVLHIQSGALEFLRQPPAPALDRFDRVMMMSMVHHLRANLPEVFALLRERLPAGGVVVIQTRGERCTLPLPPRVVEMFVRDTPTVADLVAVAEQAGFGAVVEEVVYPAAVPKEHYLGMIQSRWISTLHGMSEDELLEVQRYVGEEMYPGVDTIRFDDKFFLLTLTSGGVGAE